MTERSNRHIVLERLPEGALTTDCFRLEDAPMPVAGPGEVVVRTIVISLDPANRGWMRGRSYRAALQAGDVMQGYTLCEVVDPGSSGIEVGTVVMCEAGWREYAAVPLSSVEPIDVRWPLTNYIGVLGITGLTAWFGLTELGRPVPGETVLVSAAAGGTGNVVGQVAKAGGARVVGITGSDAKNRMLEEEFGFDATVNHRNPELYKAIKRACPDGIDVYFDNVGGTVLEAVLPQMVLQGRVVCCGSISQYEKEGVPAGVVGVPGLVTTRRLRLEGFILTDYAPRYAEGRTRLGRLLDAGLLRPLEDVLDGLETAPEGLVGLLAGDNIGKRMVRVGPDPAS